MRRRALFVLLAAMGAAGTGVAAHARDPAAPPAVQGSPALQIASLDRRIADLDAEEAQAKKELGELGGRLSEARARVVTRGRAFYRLTRAGMLPVGGGFDELVGHAMRVIALCLPVRVAPRTTCRSLALPAIMARFGRACEKNEP